MAAVCVDYSGTDLTIRDDLRQAHHFLWEHIRSPGNWWSGAERVAIAAECRNASRCSYCAQRKAALSPNMVNGRHDSIGALPEAAVEAVHRIRTDSARLSKKWFDSLIAAGLDETHYVELVGVVTLLSGVDYFARALGMEPFALPEPLPGAASGYRPPGAK